MVGIRTSGGGGGDKVHNEDKQGSDCSGSDGDTSRVLTLSNTSLSKNEMVSLDRNLLTSSDYTINHLNTNTTITFNVAVYDDQKIRIQYFT